jgi:hypothetical protein
MSLALTTSGFGIGEVGFPETFGSIVVVGVSGSGVGPDGAFADTFSGDTLNPDIWNATETNAEISPTGFQEGLEVKSLDAGGSIVLDTKDLQSVKPNEDIDFFFAFKDFTHYGDITYIRVGFRSHADGSGVETEVIDLEHQYDGVERRLVVRTSDTGESGVTEQTLLNDDEGFGLGEFGIVESFGSINDIATTSMVTSSSGAIRITKDASKGEWALWHTMDGLSLTPALVEHVYGYTFKKVHTIKSASSFHQGGYVKLQVGRRMS